MGGTLICRWPPVGFPAYPRRPGDAEGMDVQISTRDLYSSKRRAREVRNTSREILRTPGGDCGTIRTRLVIT